MLCPAIWSGDKQTTNWRIEAVCKRFRDLSRQSTSIKLHVKAKDEWWERVYEYLLVIMNTVEKLEVQVVGHPHLVQPVHRQWVDLGLGYPSSVQLPNLSHLAMRSSGNGVVDGRQMGLLLKRLTGLTRLDLASCNLGASSQLTEALLCLVSLSSLRLHACRVAPVVLMAVEKLERLTFLDIGGNDMGRPGMVFLIAALPKLRELRTLDLSSCFFADAPALIQDSFVDALGGLSGLTSLNLQEMKPFPFSLIARAIAQLTLLTSLDLGMYAIGVGSSTNPGLLEAVVKLPRLTHLDILHVPLINSGAHLGEKLMELKTLSSLVVGGNGISALYPEVIAALGGLTGLATLDIEG